eukprot:SAG31_NODE_3198_length_4565_cov_4.748097_4_plen_130_part_00
MKRIAAHVVAAAEQPEDDALPVASSTWQELQNGMAPLQTNCWEPIDVHIDDVDSIFSTHPDPLAALAAGTVPAIILRQAFPARECAAIINRFIERGMMRFGLPNRYISAAKHNVSTARLQWMQIQSAVD